MQPNRILFRRVTLVFLFVVSVLFITAFSVKAEVDTALPQTSADITEPSEAEVGGQLEAEVIRDAQIAESRADKVALYVNYVPVCGVTTEYNGRDVLVPARFFVEAILDCRVLYSASTGKLNIYADGLTFEAQCGNQYVKANRRYLFVEDGVYLRDDGQIWLPISVLSKIFGIEYTFDSESMTAHLTPTGKFIKSGDKYYDDEDVYWLSRIISAEARGESLYGQIAVGNVIMNRVAHKKFPNTIYDVIFHGNQFSPAVSGSVYNDPTDLAVIAAKIVLEGECVSDKILYFHSIKKTDERYWDFENTETELVIGRHYFYTVYTK